ncbi:hypothetical protein HMPREF9551_02937 [Escherichia coli MS 196-1]|nr:hypothetical protein HMPREF9551_02937 [Escherichia coli MS 196-1]
MEKKRNKTKFVIVERKDKGSKRDCWMRRKRFIRPCGHQL